MMRSCLRSGCSALTTASYCKPHYLAQRRGLYTHRHAERSRAVRAAQPYCSWCGAVTDLVADHVVPGHPDSPLRTLCRSCNSARANRGRVHRYE